MDTNTIISSLDTRPHNYLSLRYEYMTAGELTAVFTSTLVASLLAVFYLILEITLTQNVTDVDAISLLHFFTTLNAVVCGLGLIAPAFSLTILVNLHLQTKPDQSPLQTSMITQNIYGLSFVISWSVILLVQGTFLTSTDCPLYLISDVILACFRDFTSALVLFVFHWAALDHLLVLPSGERLLARSR